MHQVAIIDDDRCIRTFCRYVAQAAGFAVSEYPSGPSFLANYEPQPGCILLGINIPEMSGMEVLQEMRRRACTVPTVAMSGYWQKDLEPKILALGALAYISKPFTVIQLVDWLNRATIIDTWQRRERQFRAMI